MTRAAFAFAALGFAALAGAAMAQDAPKSVLPETPPPPFHASEAPATPDTWIFTGVLAESHESFSGTLVATNGESEFELKLAGGATCDGSELQGDVGLVRLPEIICTDDRPLRALFVPQGGQSLKVFGHVGKEHFIAEAHLLGTEAAPEQKQTAQPKGPLGMPMTPEGSPAPK